MAQPLRDTMLLGMVCVRVVYAQWKVACMHDYTAQTCAKKAMNLCVTERWNCFRSVRTPMT
jgi:hypothetical protein